MYNERYKLRYNVMGGGENNDNLLSFRQPESTKIFIRAHNSVSCVQLITARCEERNIYFDIMHARRDTCINSTIRMEPSSTVFEYRNPLYS